MKKNLLITVYIVISLLILFLSVRGLPGNPDPIQLNDLKWKNEGPLELSPERGRYALLYSIVEDQSATFSLGLARFTAPDVAYSNGNYVSLFAPGLSFISVPGYLIGKYLGSSQVGAFMTVSLFALFNLALIYLISVRLGANKIAATLGGMVFLFATPSYAYAVNLYQHHITTFLILLSVYLLIRSTSLLSLSLVMFLFAFAVPLDYPNLVFMTPIAIYAAFNFFKVLKEKEMIIIKPIYIKMISVLGMSLPIAFFLWFNTLSYGSPFNMLGSSNLEVVETIDEKGKPHFKGSENQATAVTSVEEKPTSGISFFQTRNLLNGFYIHFFSPERGIVYFTPVILMGFIGLFIAYRRKLIISQVLLGVMGLNILLYSMWGDPWGGWAFGSRYLIPTYAVLSVFLSLALCRFRKKSLFLLPFTILLSYSIFVNTLGAITSSRIPTKPEVLALEQLSGREEKYTYERSYDVLMAGISKSYVFQIYAKEYLTAAQYFTLLLVILLSMTLPLVVVLRLIKGEKNDV